MEEKTVDRIECALLNGLAEKTKYYRGLARPLDYSSYDVLFSNRKRSRWQEPSPLTVVYVDGYNLVKTTSAFVDDRVIRNENLIKQTIQYAKKNNLPVPKTKLHIWVSDRQPWFAGVEESVPIYTYAAPAGSRFVLFPDNSFDCLETAKKYDGSGLNWDQMKDCIRENLTTDKKPIIFFKGTPTTIKHSKIREQLYLNATNNTLCTGKESLFKPSDRGDNNYVNSIFAADVKHVPPTDKMVIQLDARKSYVPVWEFAKYKYLLNLPGHYPWSNRMKYLFMTRSLVINVSVTTVGSDYVDEPFETVTSYIFKQGTDYLDCNMTYFVPKNRHALQTCTEQITENNRVYNAILSTVDVSDSTYDKITNSAYSKANELNLDHIYKYIYRVILFNAEIF